MDHAYPPAIDSSLELCLAVVVEPLFEPFRPFPAPAIPGRARPDEHASEPTPDEILDHRCVKVARALDSEHRSPVKRLLAGRIARASSTRYQNDVSRSFRYPGDEGPDGRQLVSSATPYRPNTHGSAGTGADTAPNARL